MENIIKRAVETLVNFCNSKVASALWPNGPTGAEYLEGLVRVKPDGSNRGSFVEGLDDLDKTIAFLEGLDFRAVDVGPEIQYKEAKYYQSSLPTGHRAFTGILTLGECREKGLPVEVVAGDHGDELRLVEAVEALSEADVISIIVEDGMMSTWYPGRFTARSPKVLPENPADWSDNWAVKVRLA